MSVASDNIKVQGVMEMAKQPIDVQRTFLARAVFGEWTGVTNPELLQALWKNLSPEDRQVWLDRIDDGVRPLGKHS
jgi:hypothetical protein